MPITLDPAKQFVEIKLFYIEQIPPQGGDVNYKFINSKEELGEWKSKGYRYDHEVQSLIKQAKPVNDKSPMPGMPITEQPFDQRKLIYSIQTKWKRMSWKDQNVIFSRCLRSVTGADGIQRTELDTITYRDMKIKQCLKDWDLKDDRGQLVPVTPDAIDNLTPEVVSELISAFERYTEASASDLGE